MPRNPGAYLTFGKLLNQMGEHYAARGTLSEGNELINAAGEDNPLAQALVDELAKARQALVKQKQEL